MENKYYLAVVTKPNNYFPINLGDLSIANNYNTDDLALIDKFTLQYREQEIKEAIRDANLLEIKDDMPLVVIYYEKKVVRAIPALTKDIDFDMWQVIKENFLDKNFKNKIFNFLNNKIDTLDNLKRADNLNDFIKIISELPYIIQRKLYFYLYEK